MLQTENPIARRERVPCHVFDSARDVSVNVAAEIAQLIRARHDAGETCVLGLATGSTPVGVYAELVRLHQEEGLSFENVITFNLDEYYPMQPNELQSYRRFMAEHLFDLIDIPPANAHVPDGSLTIDEVSDYCAEYEAQHPAGRRDRHSAAGHRPDRSRGL